MRFSCGWACCYLRRWCLIMGTSFISSCSWDFSFRMCHFLCYLSVSNFFNVSQRGSISSCWGLFSKLFGLNVSTVRMSRASANVFAGINASAGIGRGVMAKTNDTNSRIYSLRNVERRPVLCSFKRTNSRIWWMQASGVASWSRQRILGTGGSHREPRLSKLRCSFLFVRACVRFDSWLVDVPFESGAAATNKCPCQIMNDARPYSR